MLFNNFHSLVYIAMKSSKDDRHDKYYTYKKAWNMNITIISTNESLLRLNKHN